jgi:hypothetical protein
MAERVGKGVGSHLANHTGMGLRRQIKACIGVAFATLMLVALPAASAFASAQVRFVNARGGGDSLTLQVTAAGGQTPAGGAIAFGQAGDLVAVPSGAAELSLSASGGESVSAKLQKTLADGASYTVVAAPKGAKGSSLEVLRNGSPLPGQAKLRVFHAAPELGSPDVRLGKRTIAQGLAFGEATRYLTVDPSSYELAVTKPNGGATVFKMPLSLAAGTATTVVAAGSGGSPEKLIEVNDATFTPAGAPHTGLGGLARGGGAPWLLALLMALAAGSLGGAAQVARGRRSRP